MNRKQIDVILLKYHDKSSLTKQEEFELIESLEYMVAHKELAYKGEYATFCEWLGGVYYEKKIYAQYDKSAEIPFRVFDSNSILPVVLTL